MNILYEKLEKHFTAPKRLSPYFANIRIPRKHKKKVKTCCNIYWSGLNNGQRMWYYLNVTNNNFTRFLMETITKKYADQITEMFFDKYMTKRKEVIIQMFNEYAKLYHESEVEKLNIPAISGSYSAEDMGEAWSEGYHRKVDEINGNELRYFDVWLANCH